MDTSDLEKRAYERIMLELTARTSMMMVHGSMLAMIGLMMMVTGAPAPIEASLGPWSRILFGGAAVVFGMTILFGAAETDNEPSGWWALLLGFGSGVLWHAGLALAYAVSAYQSRMMILEPGEVLDAAITSRGYIPLVYVGYALLTALHLRTVWKLGPPPR